MAQRTDRWVTKVLALPVFTHAFSRALIESPLANLALIASIEVSSGTEFVQKVSEWAPTLDPEVARALLARPDLLEQFWCIAISIEKLFFESTSTQLGFGLCEPARAHKVLSDSDVLRKQAAIKALVQKQVKGPKRLKTEPLGPTGPTPLLDAEQAEKHRWAARLEEIGRRAGPWAKLFQSFDDGGELTSAESAKLRHLVLTSSAHRTMSAYVRSWERFELWAASSNFSLFPLSVDKILKYCLWLDDRECGPSVIPSFRSAARWITSRLAIECPDLEDTQLVALQRSVVEKRAKALKEAVPVPIELVKCLEFYIVSEAPGQARLFVWWWVCLIFASLRFDDGIHVNPKDLVLNENGLFGVSWQTKVERKRRGTKFVIPLVGFSGKDWVVVGWELLFSESPLRDFWVPDLNSRSEFRMAPPDHLRSVQWFKVLAREALDTFTPTIHLSVARAREVALIIPTLTAHSARVTLLDAAVHAGRTTEEIGLQANWKNPGPLVLKYTRNRSDVPARMVQQLVRDLLSQDHPVQESEDVMLDEPDALHTEAPEFFLKQPAPGSYYDYKFHCSSKEDPDLVACRKLTIAECCSMGSTLPDLSVFCKACSRARPEIAQTYETS